MGNIILSVILASILYLIDGTLWIAYGYVVFTAYCFISTHVDGTSRIW